MGKSIAGGVFAFILILGVVSAPVATASNGRSSHGNGHAYGKTKHEKHDKHKDHKKYDKKHNDKHDDRKKHDTKDNHVTSDKETGNHVPVTICHKTGSKKNPYVVITVDDDSITHGKGHAKHHAHGDIIPPFTADDGTKYPGLNWTTRNQALHANGCKVKTVTPVEDRDEDYEEDVVETPVTPTKPTTPVTPNETEKTITPVVETPETAEKTPEAPVDMPSELPTTGTTSPVALIAGLMATLATTVATYLMRTKLAASEE